MDHDDFEHEPIRGLPEMLPPGERILWQGAPDVRALLRDALRIRWVSAYFLVLFAWKTVDAAAAIPWAAAAGEASFFLVLWGVTAALLWAVAWAQAKATVYTVTDRRVVMRIGAALTMTLQFPYRWIGAADLKLAADGTGTVAFQTLGRTRMSYLMTWPHVRPWRFNPTQPALRCIPDAASVARLIADAAGAVPSRAAAADPSEPQHPGGLAVPAE
ncbi:photosynthetic complex putative assembly protein PuhB [Jannaschia sp. LMIT008]|uniref:photosynthetic complex putative assembly protein PuhB n=1 Tax=Jannaschia maritima TaxID=3032585 RepID=UPI00281157DE|nr:photosynthetic complex putative assembly protein PuhB [Jannaschia sp. LMIT008]